MMHPPYDRCGRAVLVGSIPPPGAEDWPAFDTRTKAGAFLAELIGRPATEVFDTRYILPISELSPAGLAAKRHGRALRVELAERDAYVIVVGIDAARLLAVSENPLMRWRREEGFDVLDPVAPHRDLRIEAPVHVATFPYPSETNAWWADPDTRAAARTWLQVQAAAWDYQQEKRAT